jgi:Flp pilus assembly protein TadG
MAEVNIASGKRRRRRCVAFIKDQKGATAVEFALIAPAFIALLVALIQTFLVFFAQELLEAVVQQSSRLILTGQVQSQQMSAATFKQAVCGEVVILFNCSGLMVDVQVVPTLTSTNTSSPTLTYTNGQVSNTWQFNPGTAGDLVVVRVMYLWPVFLGPLGFNLADQPNNNKLLQATAAFQNEPSS